MSNKIDLIMSSVQQFCREGYLLPKNRQTLYDLAELHEIAKEELEDCLNRELTRAKKSKLDRLYQASKQPDAAISDVPDLFQESRRQFPDVLKVGHLTLKLNKEVTAPAFIPVRDTCGVCVLHNDVDAANAVVQNLVVRIMLSLPRSLATVTILDTVSFGADFIGLSGLDSRLLNVIDDEKAVLTFLQTCMRDIASFNFNELGNRFADVAEYNKTNRSKARPYKLIVFSSFPSGLDKNAMAELKRIAKLAAKTGVFFLLAVNAQQLEDEPTLLDFVMPNLCCIDLRNQNDPMVVGQEQMELFNNGFDLHVDDHLEFSAETLTKINHEFDPEKWVISTGGDDTGLDAIESLDLTIGKTEAKDKYYGLSLKKENDNVLVCAGSREQREAIVIAMLNALTSNYKRSELSFILSNCAFLDTCQGDNVVANVQSNKLTYINGLLKRIENDMASRESMFNDIKASDYADFRTRQEQVLPRMVCVLNDLEFLLDSDSLMAAETASLLDTLLAKAGRFGIHFILSSQATPNLLKLNVGSCISEKLLSTLSGEEALQMGIYVTDNDTSYMTTPEHGLSCNGKGVVQVKLSLDATTSEGLAKTKQSLSESAESAIVAPKLFVDVDNTFPSAYLGINARKLALGNARECIPIGMPRQYAMTFSSIQRNVSPLMVVGNDEEGVYSLLQSIHIAVGNAMTVYDAVGRNPIGLPGMAGLPLYNQLGTMPLPENGIVCLLNMDAYDDKPQDEMEMLMAKARSLGTKVILFSKEDLTLSGKIGLAASLFEEKMALCEAPEGFVSPVHFILNENLALPTSALEALYERPDALSGTQIESVWLFKY